jgi:protein involved in polysaccharide export with SLBB domain
MSPQPRLFILPALLLFGASCATVKKYTPDLGRLPKPAMPSFAGLKKLKNILPGMPGTDQASGEDPQVAFEASQKLGYGHTLRLHIYEGARSTRRIYNGVVMVDPEGLLDFHETGKASVGGSDLIKAAESIATTFRVGMRLTRPVTVHILSVEDVPLVAVRGDVVHERYLPAWEGMTVAQAVAQAGGRKPGSNNRGVYLVREGLSRYYPGLDAAGEKEPEPGDIIQLSTDF